MVSMVSLFDGAIKLSRLQTGNKLPFAPHRFINAARRENRFSASLIIEKINAEAPVAFKRRFSALSSVLLQKSSCGRELFTARFFEVLGWISGQLFLRCSKLPAKL